jgi:phosphotransferase system IIA component
MGEKVRFGIIDREGVGTYEGIMGGEITKICKRVGDTVKAGDSIVEIETDKVNIDVEAPVSGTLVSLTDPKDATLGEDWKEGEQWNKKGEEDTPHGKLLLPALGEIETGELS